jgi:PAS domain S-box-containing protein
MATRVQNGFRESEEGYRLLFESNPHPMWIYDRDTLAFLAVNDAAVKHYGYSRDEFLRMTLKDIRPPEDIPWLLKKISDIKPGMNSASSRHLKKDGAVFPVEIVSHTLPFNDRRAELVMAMDVAKDHADSHLPRDVAVDNFKDAQLTETERRVAKFVARGFSNKQIASTLRISVRTVENHISHILGKKRFANRVEIARYVITGS